MVRVIYRHRVHLATQPSGDAYRLVCNAAVLWPQRVEVAAETTKLTCKDCAAWERRQRKEKRT